MLEENHRPFFVPNYKIPIGQREIVNNLVQEMKDQGVVIPSTSPYNSPLLLVPKKDKSFRLVIDYRKLNSQTIPDRMPMPVIGDVLSQLGGAKVFSSLDLLSGYFQVPLEKESQPLTAFSTHNEHLEFTVMPFGLTSAPLTFVRLMQSVLGNIDNVFCYLDDIIIHSKTIEEHLITLEKVLTALKDAGLKLKLKKCQFLRNELEFLGHRVTAEGIRMQQAKIEAIVQYPPPINVKGVRRFLGLIGYYRPFIQGFSSIAYPLNQLLRQDVPFHWEQDQQTAFEELKSKLMQDPILIYPDFNKEFYIACDASGYGLGAVLLQKGKLRLMPISFASRSLNDAEKRYSATERECLAIVWALKKFRHTILGFKVNILTDHRPLLDLFKKRAFTNNQKFNRWFISVLEFGPNFQYIPGRFNTMADSLSRMNEADNVSKGTYSFSFSCKLTDLDLDLVREEQQKDDQIREILGELLSDSDYQGDYQLINGSVYKRPVGQNDCARLYVPATLRQEVLNLVHSHSLAGHPGLAKTCKILTRNYFWRNCTVDAKEFISKCEVCNKHKGVVNRPAPLEKYPSDLFPFEMVSMDTMGPFPTTQNNFRYILVFIDYLTRYTEVVPIRNRNAATVAEALKHRIITRHSCPKVLISDNALEFTSALLNSLCDFYDIKKVQIVAHKPSSNGLVERANKKILDVLKTLVTPSSTDWDSVLDDVQFAINSIVNKSTGETPHYLLYGYDKRTPYSLVDDAVPPRRTYNYDDYIAYRTRKSYDMYHRTRLALDKAFAEYKGQYDKKTVVPQLKVGMKVYVKKGMKDGPMYKVSESFEGPYRIIELLKYHKIKLVDISNGNTRVCHSNNVKVIKGDIQKPSNEHPVSLQDDLQDAAEVPSRHRYNLRTRD